MKSNKVFSIIVFLLILGSTCNVFSMNSGSKSLEPYERFKIITGNETDFKHIGFRQATSSCGRYVVSGEYRKVRVWDKENNKEKCSYSHGIRIVNCVCFSKGGKYVASGENGSRGKVIVWDIEKNEKIFSYSHGRWLFCVYFSEDDNRLTSICRCGREIVHKTSCEFSLDQQLFKARKKQEKSFTKALWKNLKNDRDGRRDLTIVCKN